MAILDLRLNFNVVVVPCDSDEELAALFHVRADIVRRGVRGSPRGRKTPRLDDYYGFFRLKLSGNYEIIAEATDGDSGLPLNMCALKFLSCELYGPVFLVQRVRTSIIELSKDVFNGSEADVLRAEGRSALRRFRNSRIPRAPLTDSDRVQLIDQAHGTSCLQMAADDERCNTTVDRD